MDNILTQMLSRFGIPSGEVKNAAGQVVFPTNALERLLQSSDASAGQYAAAFMGPGGMRTFHGSRSGVIPEIASGKPFYTTPHEKMANEYAREAVLSGKAKSATTTEYNVDPSGYMSRADYQKILDKHLPNDSWIKKGYPSEAATVEHPGILRELQNSGVKGVRDLWDFGMDPMTEHQVMVTLDPATIKSR